MTLQNVTVIIPAHNRPKRLRRLLDYYSRTDIKILVPDSSDHPFADAEKYPDITYLHRPKLHFLLKLKDGWGVIFLRKLNIPVAIMTGENTQIVQKRADKLKIDYCYLGVKDKVAQAEELCRELGITLQDVAFIGDDVNDLALLRKVGFSASPSNTPDYVKREVDYVTAQHGGFGAFREFVEKLLSDNGMLEGVLQQFLS